ncbi:MAG: hypothetical protein V1702_04835 [Candidatus Woesearchaeota archaeon]
MGKKRASSQIDWIISLAIFLLYLAWFFVYVRNLVQPSQSIDTLLSDMRDAFVRNSTWSVSLMPLFVRTNMSGTEPIITDFNLGWKNFSFSDNAYFELRSNKLFFIKNLISGVNTYYLAQSDDSYSLPETSFELDASADIATMNSEAFTAEIENSLISKIGYDGSTGLTSLQISLNSEPVDPLSAVKKTNITSMLAEYRFETQSFNQSAFIISGFPRVISYVWLSNAQNNVTISMTLANYTHYYVAEDDAGGIAYNSSICRTRETRYMDFYNAYNGVTIITSDIAKIRNCQDEDGLQVTLEIPAKNETRYDLIFHEGGYNSTIKYISNYAAEFGMAQNLTGISLDAVGRINSTDYGVLKTQWQYPEKRDFNFILSNSTDATIYDYSPVSPGNENVFAMQEKLYALDKNGNRELYKLRLLGW